MGELDRQSIPVQFRTSLDYLLRQPVLTLMVVMYRRLMRINDLNINKRASVKKKSMGKAVLYNMYLLVLVAGLQSEKCGTDNCTYPEFPISYFVSFSHLLHISLLLVSVSKSKVAK